MIFCRAIYVLLGSLFLCQVVAHAETTEACLNRLTQEREQKKKAAIDKCWERAEGPSGVISDNSDANQSAILCEKEETKSFQVSDTSVQECYNKGVDLFGGAVIAPDPGSKDHVPAPKSRPSPIPSKTTPVAKDTPRHPTPPQTSGPSTRPQSADIAQDNANTDLNACATTRNQASQCCNNPLSCASSLSAQDQMSLQQLMQQTNSGPASGQSIADYCNQMQQASQSSGSVNNGLSAVCYSNQSSCTNTCSSLVQKYQALVDNCGDCDASSVYSSALASLQSSLGSCQNLQANMNAMARQGIGSANGQALGSICSQQASFNPQSAGSNSLPVPQAAATTASADAYGCQQNPQSVACQACAMNPRSPGCQAIQQANPTGRAGFQTASKTNSEFNPMDESLALAQAQAKMNMATASAPAPANQNHAALVPNNSGGAIPGQAGGQQARADLSSGRPAGPALAGANTDILQGHMAGGYSQQGNGSGFESINANARRGYASVNGRAHPYAVGFDLKKVLPGGSLDPARIAALNSVNAEINGKGVDLFKKISNKMEEKCKLGILWECRP